MEEEASQYEIRAAMGGAIKEISSAVIVYRTSDENEFGPLNGLQGHVSQGVWTRAPATIDNGELRASIPVPEDARIAFFFEAAFDDGSGELTLVTSPVLVR